MSGKIPKSKLFWGNNELTLKDNKILKKIKFFLITSVFIPNLLFIFKKDLKNYKNYPTFSFIIRKGYIRIINILLYSLASYNINKLSISRKAIGLSLYNFISTIIASFIFIFPDNDYEICKKHRKIAIAYFSFSLIILFYIKNIKLLLILMLLLTFLFIHDFILNKKVKISKIKCLVEHVYIYFIALNFYPLLE